MKSPTPDKSGRGSQDGAHDMDEEKKRRSGAKGVEQPPKRTPDRRPTAGLVLDTGDDDDDRAGIPDEPEM
ncbi:hypothetical protein AB0F46_13675 [Streptomyces sp. NPDC026665]|uniref:hypothetical protein n=1 Tax=Streptomyces sp. NPDC026665 TaxID=3154798 RepID=UPI003401EA5A